MAEHNDDAIRDFHAAVNMTAGQIEKWLGTDQSQEVGQKKDGAEESTGHQSGRRIIEILHKKKSDYTEGDITHMQKVVSYVHRHLAQHPAGDVKETHWRYSLMNWGHDPLKD
jgi:hypothetical protein